MVRPSAMPSVAPIAKPMASRASVSLSGPATWPSASRSQSTRPMSDGAGSSDRFTSPWCTACSMPHSASAMTSAPGASCPSHLGMRALALHQLRQKVVPQLEETALLAGGDWVAWPRQSDIDDLMHARRPVREHGDPVGEINRFVDIMGDEQDAEIARRPQVEQQILQIEPR